MWYRQKPDFNKIRVFGSVAFVHIPAERRQGKLEPQSEKMYMIGYTNNGYRLWNPKTKTIISARNVIFDENTNFPGQETPNTLLPDVDLEENVPETNIKESKPEFPELEGHVNREKPKVGTQPIR